MTFGYLHVQANNDAGIDIDPNAVPLQHRLSTSHVNTFRVEADIVTPIFAGLQRLPILCTFRPLSCAQGAIHKEFVNLQYQEARKKSFQSVHIVINDGDGHLVPFASGIAIATLDFRRKKQDAKANV